MNIQTAGAPNRLNQAGLNPRERGFSPLISYR